MAVGLLRSGDVLLGLPCVACYRIPRSASGPSYGWFEKRDGRRNFLGYHTKENTVGPPA